MKLAFTIDVEEEGLFSGKYQPEEPPTRNIFFLSQLDPLVAEFELRPTLMVSYQAIRAPRHGSYITDLCQRWQGEIGAHLHAWNTPPLVDLPYRQPVPSDLMPRDILTAKLATLFKSLADLGVAPTSFRMGRFNLGPQMLSILSETSIMVDSSVAPMRSYYGGPRHLEAPTDPYYPDPNHPARPGNLGILEVPLTILPILPGAGSVFRFIESRPFPPGAWAAWAAQYLASLPAQPVWTGLNRLKLACRLHRRRGGRVLTIFLHSSELMPGGCPRHQNQEQVNQFLQRLRSFLSWLRQDLAAEPVTLSELARLEKAGQPHPATSGLKEQQLNPPRLAYILLWFPKPSETFIFREVVKLWEMGLDIKVFTLYGELTEQLSPEMRSVSDRMERLGRPYLKHCLADLAYWFKKRPRATLNLLRTVLLRPPKGLEKTGENLWALICAFRLARRFQELGIDQIHAPWANGPATAAWLASRLTGIPFSFTARAWDIYPPDNLLPDKTKDALFIRSETAHNIPFLKTLTDQAGDKFHLTYNGVPLQAKENATVPMKPPYQLLALGRLVGKKGYSYLLEACALLRAKGLPFHLTLAGDGPEMGRLKSLCAQLELDDLVSFPGFVTHDHVPELFQQADLFVMPSVIHSSGDRDGIPLVLMEALLHRVPVAATNVSGIPELIQDGLTGRLVPEKNPEALAAAMENLLTNRPLALKLAENGRHLVLRQFEPNANYRLVRDLFVRYQARLAPEEQG